MLNRLITYFTNPKDAQDPERLMQARYFVASTWLFQLLALISIPYYWFAAPEQIDQQAEILASNIFFIALIAFSLFAYRKWGGRVLWVNIVTAFGYGSNWQTYLSNGGIWSSDLVWGLIISAWVFLVANRWSGTIWMGLTIVAFFFHYNGQATTDHNFIADLTHMGAKYALSNWVLSGSFLLVIIYLYDASKKKFVRELRESKSEVEHQKKALESQKEDILASINYAKKIQQAVLPHEEIISRGIPLSFILYKPRDIVSGDFYWFYEIDRDNYIFACGDCTGHGVPGAFMTVIGCNLLTQIIKENKIHTPGEILVQLDLRINETLKQDHARYSEVQDGMDLSLIKVNKTKKEFTYTSAKRPAIFIRNKEQQELKGSKLSIGGMRTGSKSFEEITVQYKEDDMIYLFTDGYIDQFGGPQNKKYMIKRFRESLQNVHNLSLPEQKRRLDDSITSWIGTNEQTDDILVCGIRF